jgi:tetratricopeptide (TPR) repeat protein
MSEASRQAIAGAALTVVLGLLAFSSVGSGGFVQDDAPLVRDNPIVKRGDVVEIFSSDWWEGVGGRDDTLYRPVATWSFSLERGPGGAVDPSRAHLVNLALHLVASLLLLALGLRLGAGAVPASAASVLFAVHPVHTAAVAGLVGRAEILATLFGLAAILCWSWAEDGRRWAVWGAAACVFLSAGSKETGLLVPLLIVAWDLLFRRGSPWIERAAALAPTALAGTLLLVLRVHALGVFPGTPRPIGFDNPLVHLAGFERFATAVGVTGRYAGLLLWPSRLSADYSGNAIAAEPSLGSFWPLAGVAFALAMLAAPFAVRGGHRRIAAFAVLLFAVPYAVVSNLVVPVGQILAERFVYFASAGFCLLVALLVAPLLGRRIALAALLLVALAGAVRTRAAVHDWRSDEALFEAVRRAVPESPRAAFALAKIRIAQGRLDEAMVLLDDAIRLWPDQSGAWTDKAAILIGRGDLAGAERALRTASIENPYNQRSVVGWGMTLAKLGRFDEAERVLRDACRRIPEDPSAPEALAAVLAERSRRAISTPRPRRRGSRDRSGCRAAGRRTRARRPGPASRSCCPGCAPASSTARGTSLP